MFKTDQNVWGLSKDTELPIACHAKGARGAGGGVDVDVPDQGLALGLNDQAGKDVDQRRFAGAVGAKQAEDRAARNFEVDPIERALSGIFAVPR